MSGHGHVHVPTREELIAATSRPVARWVKLACLALAAIGLVVFALGLFTDADRAWRAYHVNWLYFTTISSAGVMFVAVQRIATARWSRAIIRLLEGYVAWLPAAFVLLLLTLFAGRNHVFAWAITPPTVHEKQIYLDPGFFTIRVIVVFTILTILSLWYVYTSVRLDVGNLPEWGAGWARGLRERMRRGYRDERREIHSTHSLQGKLAVFLTLAFAFGWIILSWDLSMSLDLHFQSTMYGWWVFMGGWVASLASFTILLMAWRKYFGAYDLITEKHFHDLGKLCFAFTAFWGYLSFGQYLVIWYGNLGEETHWMRLRFLSPYEGLTMAVMFLMFFLPFFGLLSHAAKVYMPTMAGFAMCTVVGLWIHRYLEVYPSLYGPVLSLPYGVIEVGTTLGYLGLWGLCYTAFMDAFPRIRATLMTSPHRDEVQIPVNPKTMEPLPAHE
jgi:hypothetical protein